MRLIDQVKNNLLTVKLIEVQFRVQSRVKYIFFQVADLFLFRIYHYRYQFRYHSTKTDLLYSNIVKNKCIVTSTIDAISTKSILAATIEGTFSVVTDCMEAAVVCFDGTLVDI